MKIKLFILALFIFASTAWAGPFEDATTAYGRKEYAVAARGYRLAAAQGDASAQYNLGNMYYNGQGVVQDYAEGDKWYRLAAAQGVAPAQYNIGLLYVLGERVVQDDTEAVKWFRLAAEQGQAEAQRRLGLMFATGRGVIQDNVSAHLWMNIAAAKGDVEAIRFRDLIAKKMTAQQIGDAQKLARECQTRSFKGCD